MVTSKKRQAARKCAPLEAVLGYRNPRVIRGFMRDYDLERSEVNLLFREMLKFLWLAGSSRKRITVWAQWKPLDDMWHSFILHTRDYQAFCSRYFGRMIHHNPATTPRAKGPRQVRRELDETIDLVADRLGLATTELWFEQFWHRYTPQFLDRHVKRPSVAIDGRPTRRSRRKHRA